MRLVEAFDIRYTLRRGLEEGVAENIRALLPAVAMTEAELGRRLGFTQASFSRRMVGESRWELPDLERVAKALGTTAEELVGASK